MTSFFAETYQLLHRGGTSNWLNSFLGTKLLVPQHLLVSLIVPKFHFSLKTEDRILLILSTFKTVSLRQSRRPVCVFGMLLKLAYYQGAGAPHEFHYICNSLLFLVVLRRLVGNLNGP